MREKIRNYLLKLLNIEESNSISKKDLHLLNTVKRDLLPKDYNPQENYVPQKIIGNSGAYSDENDQ